MASGGHRQLTLSWGEPPASPSAFKDSEKAWMTLVANLRDGSLKSLAQYVHTGSSGKTSPMSCELTEGELLLPSSGGWQSSGIAVPGECWTLGTSASPRDAIESSLSDIIESGSFPPPLSLTAPQAEKMAARLRKYSNDQNPLLLALQDYLAGLGTRHPNSDMG